MLSLRVELSRILNNRSTDMDDLILNTAGAVLGHGAFRLSNLVSGGKIRGKINVRMESVLFVAVVFLGCFFL